MKNIVLKISSLLLGETYELKTNDFELIAE